MSGAFSSSSAKLLMKQLRSDKYVLFSHPDYTVGTGIPSYESHRFSRTSSGIPSYESHRFSRTSCGSRTIPPVGTCTRPRRFYSFYLSTITLSKRDFKSFVKNSSYRSLSCPSVSPARPSDSFRPEAHHCHYSCARSACHDDHDHDRGRVSCLYCFHSRTSCCACIS